MASEVQITFLFDGGPLDGKIAQQTISADWELIRYEHQPALNTSVRHLYSGRRDLDETAVRLRYVEAHTVGTVT